MIIEKSVNAPIPEGKEKGPEDTVLNVAKHLHTCVLADTNNCSWPLSWALWMLQFIATHVTTCETLRLLAVRGLDQHECDEQCYFVGCILQELGFEERPVMQNIDNPPLSLFKTWDLRRRGMHGCQVILKQWKEIEGTKYVDMEQDFAPYAGYNYEPKLMRAAIISCPTFWVKDGVKMRLNPREKNEDHPDGMTMSDRFHLNVMDVLERVRKRANDKGFHPIEAGHSSEESHRAFKEYFDL